MNSSPTVRLAEKSGSPSHLKRALGLWMLVLYGLGTIVGAGIYIVVGEVAEQAGMATPLAFFGAALLAAFTGLAYAELAARFPEAAGAAAYVEEGFRSAAAARIIGFLVLFSGVVIAASLARGSAVYLTEFISLSTTTLSGALVILFTGIACLNVRESVGLAAVLTGVELLGLAFVIFAGAPALMDLPERARELIPAGLPEWRGVGAGAFLAFFAYLGFEGLANMAEEAKSPRRTLPRAIILSIAISSALYIAVALIVVLAIPLQQTVESNAPLALIVERSGWAAPELFLIIAVIAVTNGLLADLLMTARLLYGMSRRGLLPAWLALVSPEKRIPIAASLAAGSATLIFAVAVPFDGLVTATAATTLVIFLMVNLALWKVHESRGRYSGIRAPRWVPPCATALCIVLLLAQIMTWITELRS